MSWKPYNGPFDPAQFNVPPTLGKGTSQRLQFYVQSAHARALDAVAHSGHFPWGKDTDVARWCIQHGLQFIDQLDIGIISSVMRQANVVHAINATEAANMQFVQTLEETQSNVNRLRGMGEPAMATDLINRIWREIQAMPDEPEQQGRWKERYRQKYESLFRSEIVYDTAA